MTTQLEHSLSVPCCLQILNNCLGEKTFYHLLRSNVTCFHLISPKELSWRSTWSLCQILLMFYGCDAGTWGRGDQVQLWWGIHQWCQQGQSDTRMPFTSLLFLPEKLEAIKFVHVHKKPWNRHLKNIWDYWLQGYLEVFVTRDSSVFNPS